MSPSINDEAMDDAAVRSDWVPADDYVSPHFMAQENEKVWSQVWQIACREQELPDVGSYLTYEINDFSIVIVRTKNGIRAYHNVCPHRGRQLVGDRGVITGFQCRYHFWKFDLDGNNVEVVDRSDWNCLLDDKDIALKRVHVANWGGWIFISLAENPAPLEDFLGEIWKRLSAYRLEEMSILWHRTIEFPCNWKVALEAFSEGYHVQATHQQLLDYNDDRTYSEGLGDHGLFSYPRLRGLAQGSPRTINPPREDVRHTLVEYFDTMIRDLNAMFTQREADEIRRLPDEVSADASYEEVITAFRRLQREAAEKSGVELPQLAPEQLKSAGGSYHIFPNMVILPMPLAALYYRARPNGSPDSCIFDIIALERWAPGKEPKWEREFSNDPKDRDFWGLVLLQDFSNMAAVQRGMKSPAFKAARTNPKQEVAISNFHKALHAYIDGSRP